MLNSQALLVTGGRRRDGNTNIALDSTEIFYRGAWTYASALPSPMHKMSGIFLNKLVYLVGENSFGKQIMSYNATSDTWSQVGTLKRDRQFPVVGIIDNVSDYCN